MGTDRRSVLVTGSSTGLGLGVARLLAEAGCQVLVHGRDRERGDAVVAEIRDAGGTAEFLELLLGDAAAIEYERPLRDEPG